MKNDSCYNCGGLLDTRSYFNTRYREVFIENYCNAVSCHIPTIITYHQGNIIHYDLLVLVNKKKYFIFSTLIEKITTISEGRYHKIYEGNIYVTFEDKQVFIKKLLKLIIFS